MCEAKPVLFNVREYLGRVDTYCHPSDETRTIIGQACRIIKEGMPVFWDSEFDDPIEMNKYRLQVVNEKIAELEQDRESLKKQIEKLKNGQS